MPSLRVDILKALKFFNENIDRISKRFNLDDVSTINSKEAIYHRKVFAQWLSEHWIEFIETSRI